ncbi:MAG: transcription-repair coupling factor [Spirochaetaceae bacterium]|nr:MAG: transcription-repair coupling factor [Spirochaetaceae bacterium]
MNTLLSDSLTHALSGYKPVRDLIFACKSGAWPVDVRGSVPGLTTFLLDQVVRATGRPLLVVMPTEQEATMLAADFERLGHEVPVFESWNVVPYQDVPENSHAYGVRSSLLHHLTRGRSPLVLTGLRAALSPLPPPETLSGSSLVLKVGDEIDPVRISEMLVSFGYQRVPTASVRGEYSLRGEVLDVMLPAGEHGIRVVFSFDEVEQLRFYDPGSQSTVSETDEIELHPLRELVWSDDILDTLEKRMRELPELERYREQVISDLREYGKRNDEYLFYPLAFEKTAVLRDYMPENTVTCMVEYERLANSAKALLEEHETLYRSEKVRRAAPRPATQVGPFERYQKGPQLRLIALDDTSDSVPVRIQSDPARSFFGNIDFLKDELSSHLEAGYRIFVCAGTEQQASRIEHLLRGYDVNVLAESVSAGFTLPELKLMVIEEEEIFGRRRRAPNSVKTAPGKALDSFVELNPGDYIVHVNYGIGRFCGIQRISAGDKERDYIHLEFGGEEFVYIPIEQVNLIQRYIGSGESPPRLDRIGGQSWQNRKSKVQKSVEDLAERLIVLYGRRQRARGFSFPTDTEWQTAFEAGFPYEETEDQLICIEDVKSDMEKPTPMDRLICGDVGYGKTEVAMRAAFKAISAGKQVAFLAPTTILAEQHFETVSERLKGFPVQVGMLSRFVSKQEQKKVLEGLADGSIDIVIGTHRVIQKDVKFRDVGLLIIDEEQRFGVKDKERLKELRANIDSLALTATPIPRTLHMSLLKIRDMSVLKTAPHNRLPIETHIGEFNEETLASAIRREVDRGGQVFYLHNRVESLDHIRTYLQKLVPEVFVETAHGRMSARELEDIMHRFVHGSFQVLVATTIIENGLDIPNVNTIIIDRADMYGISQLYQLKGRVGRSDRHAYAYLFYPESRALSEIAMKRLQVISDFTELGSGFKIALKDLEVRGAGNLLGRQQSGDILSVGFDMYLRLLDDAVRRMSNEDVSGDDEVYLDLDYTGFIPDSYVSEPSDKMDVYKRIAGVNDAAELDSVHAELADRFGPLPEEVLSLLGLAEIRILCKRLHVESLKERSGVLEVIFGKVAELSVDRVLRAIESTGGGVRLDPKRPNVLLVDTEGIDLKSKSEFIRDRLHALVGK